MSGRRIVNWLGPTDDSPPVPIYGPADPLPSSLRAGHEVLSMVAAWADLLQWVDEEPADPASADVRILHVIYNGEGFELELDLRPEDQHPLKRADGTLLVRETTWGELVVEALRQAQQVTRGGGQ